MQKYTSKNTSINSNKLPASTKKIDWARFQGQKVVDFGGGKFDNLVDYLKFEYDIDLFVYDKYNRTWMECWAAATCNPSAVICNNLFNVIAENEVLTDCIRFLAAFKVPVFISVYEGDKSGVGRATKKDCYQRNEKLSTYIPLLEKHFNSITMKSGVLECKSTH